MIDHGVNRFAIDAIRIKLPSLRLSHDRCACRRGVVQKPAPLPALAQHAVVGVAQRHLEVGYVAHEHLAERYVPLVERKCTLDVAAAVSEVGSETLGREPALGPRPRGAVLLVVTVLGEKLLGHGRHRTPPIDMIEAR